MVYHTWDGKELFGRIVGEPEEKDGEATYAVRLDGHSKACGTLCEHLRWGYADQFEAL